MRGAVTREGTPAGVPLHVSLCPASRQKVLGDEGGLPCSEHPVQQ